MPLGLLGKRLGQTLVYTAQGVITPVTIVLAGPNRVLQCKTQQTDGYNSVQLGFDDQKEHRLTKPLLGHVKKFNGVAVKRIREFRNFSKEVKSGEQVGATLFAHGDYVVIRESKKQPKGWKPHAQRAETLKKGEGKKK